MSSHDTIAFSQGPMEAASAKLHELSNFINAELDVLLGQARKWEAASSGATKMAAQQAIASIQGKQTQISTFTAAYGTRVSDSASEMLALDRRLASTIDVG